MNKKFFAILILSVVMMKIMAGRLAAVEATTSVFTEEKLLAAVTQEGSTIVLGADITLTANTIIRESVTIDLNGKTLNTGKYTIAVFANVEIKDSCEDGGGNITGNGSFKIQVGSGTEEGSLTIESGTVKTEKYYGIRVMDKGNLTINDGTIKAPSYTIYVEGSCVINGGEVISEGGPAIQVKGKEIKEMLTINDGMIEAIGDAPAIQFLSNAAGTINGGTIKALYDDPEQITGGIGINAYKNTRVTINDGVILSSRYGLSGNDSDDGVNEGTNAEFIVTGGTIYSGYGAGIYAPQVNGKVTISGGTITGGRTGIEVRAGALTISGGTITGNQEEYDCFANGNNMTTKGAAVSVCQHYTKQPITVSISGGKFYGYVPFSEVNNQNNTQEDVAKINYDISGGEFRSSGSESVQVMDFLNGPFIRGGVFSHDPSLGYVHDNYSSVKIQYPAGADYSVEYRVGIIRTLTISCDGNGKAAVDYDGTIIYGGEERKDLFVSGMQGTLLAAPDEGYLFDGWTVVSGNVSIVNNVFKTPDEDVEIKAVFIPKTYTLSVNSPAFDDVVYEYSQPGAKPIGIVSSGNSDTTIASVALRGEEKNSFILNKTDGITVKSGETDNASYLIQPAAGLPGGTHTAVIVITYDNGETATASVTIKVLPKKVEKPTVVLSEDSVAFNGKEQKPSVTVKDGEKIIPSEEYTISYRDNTEAGTAYVTITDIDGGSYTVNGNAQFVIRPIQTIVWVNEDGSTVDRLSYEKGEKEPVTSKIPTKESDALYKYTFERWEKVTAENASERISGKIPVGMSSELIEIYVPIFKKKLIKLYLPSDTTLNWEKGSQKALVSTTKRAEDDASCYTHFTGVVEVDGKKAIRGQHFTDAPGSTVITFSAEFLESLAVGDHLIRIVFDDGEAVIPLSIVASTADTTPTTGDSSSPALWALLMIMALSGVVIHAMLRKKDLL